MDAPQCTNLVPSFLASLQGVLLADTTSHRVHSYDRVRKNRRDLCTPDPVRFEYSQRVGYLRNL